MNEFHKQYSDLLPSSIASSSTCQVEIRVNYRGRCTSILLEQLVKHRFFKSITKLSLSSGFKEMKGMFFDSCMWQRLYLLLRRTKVDKLVIISNIPSKPFITWPRHVGRVMKLVNKQQTQIEYHDDRAHFGAVAIKN